MYFNGIPVWENQNALFCRNRQDKGEMLYAAFNLNVYTKNCSAYTELILPEDSQYTYAVSMEKENGYLLELYFTAAMDDGTYFLVTCCYNPIDTVSRYATQTAVFSMETQ